MPYFAAIDDCGIIIRAAESREDLDRPNEWRKVPDLRDHLNDRGFARLDAGKTIVFTQQDQSYPQLAALFA